MKTINLFKKNSPIWHYIGETEEVDLSHYDPDKCFNGGCYSYTTRKLFFGRKCNGKTEFCYMIKKTTSSDFDYSSDGCFTDTFLIKIRGTDLENLTYKIQKSHMNSWNYEGDNEDPLCIYSEPCTLQDVLNELSDEECLAYRNKVLKKIGIKNLN